MRVAGMERTERVGRGWGDGVVVVVVVVVTRGVCARVQLCVRM